MREFVGYSFQNLVKMCGGEAIFQRDWLVNVDGDVIKSFAKAKVI